VTYRSLERVLREMKIKIPITPGEVDQRQAPQSILEQPFVTGMPSKRGVRENLLSLRARIKHGRARLLRMRKDIQKARALTMKAERQRMR
jgi:hypothetical protein